MNLTIIDENASLKYIQSNNLILLQNRKRTNRTLLIQGLIAVAWITYDIIAFNDNFWKIGSGAETKYYNFHFGLGIGITLILVIFGNLRKLNLDRNKFITIINETVKRHFSNSKKQTLIITDEFVKFESEVLKSEFKWLLITSFMIIDNYIFLIRDSSFATSVLIDKRLLNESEFNELETFLRKTKPETKEFHNPI